MATPRVRYRRLHNPHPLPIRSHRPWQKYRHRTKCKTGRTNATDVKKSIRWWDCKEQNQILELSSEGVINQEKHQAIKKMELVTEHSSPDHPVPSEHVHLLNMKFKNKNGIAFGSNRVWEEVPIDDHVHVYKHVNMKAVGPGNRITVPSSVTNQTIFIFSTGGQRRAPSCSSEPL